MRATHILLPSPPVLRGRGAGGEGDSIPRGGGVPFRFSRGTLSPLTPALSPRSTGGRGGRQRRTGITLFEVVVALVIFTLTLPALATLVQVGARRALESSQLAKASLECRSKLAEVTVGAEALDGTDWTPLLETNWFWKLDASDGAVEGLKQVQVSVKFDDGIASPVQVTLSQIIIDPANRGSTQDRAIIASLASSGSSSSSGMSNAADPAASTNNAGMTDPGTTATPAATPAATPSATPATGGGSPQTGTGGGASSGAGGGTYGGGASGGGMSPSPAGASGKGGSR